MYIRITLWGQPQAAVCFVVLVRLSQRFYFALNRVFGCIFTREITTNRGNVLKKKSPAALKTLPNKGNVGGKLKRNYSLLFVLNLDNLSIIHQTDVHLSYPPQTKNSYFDYPPTWGVASIFRSFKNYPPNEKDYPPLPPRWGVVVGGSRLPPTDFGTPDLGGSHFQHPPIWGVVYIPSLPPYCF